MRCYRAPARINRLDGRAGRGTAARFRAAQGFTLIELIVVIVITSVLAVFIVFFLGTPVDAYFAQSRRATLVDSADHLMRSVATDVESALPSSLRAGTSGSVVGLEMLATSGVARYYGPGDKAGLPPAQEQQEELSIGMPDTSFYTLDQFASLNSGNYLAVGNQGTLAGAYAFGTVMTPAPKCFAISAVGGLPPPVEDWVQSPTACLDFTPASPTNSVFQVLWPVSYLCDTGAGTVQRYSGYSISAAQPLTDAALMAAGATRALIAQNVSACTINIVPPPVSATFNQLLILEVTLANSGETLVVFDEAAPEYPP
jgi:MSHA biogenesis protein MshO